METAKNQKIVILGISEKPERYSYKAYQKLKQFGYDNLVGVAPRNPELEELSWVSSLKEVEGDIDTLTLYVGAQRLEDMIDQVLALNPKRIISNPGTENINLITQAREKGIEVIEGCTLVMLSTDQF